MVFRMVGCILLVWAHYQIKGGRGKDVRQALKKTLGSKLSCINTTHGGQLLAGSIGFVKAVCDQIYLPPQK